MKTLSIVLLLSSPLLFAADGLTIKNSSLVGRSDFIYRGKEPKTLVTELATAGISDVIIFKNDVRGEVVKEIADLRALNITPHHIPFRYKEFASMAEACEQIVEALSIIEKVRAQNKKVFFHCTAGEDRTGTLAALYRMMDEGLTQETVFREEMCDRGYSDGNSHKPFIVTNAIQKELTPLFIALAGKIERGEWRLGKVTKKSCQNIETAPTSLRCKR